MIQKKPLVGKKKKKREQKKQIKELEKKEQMKQLENRGSGILNPRMIFTLYINGIIFWLKNKIIRLDIQTKKSYHIRKADIRERKKDIVR